MYQHILYAVEAPVATITMNRPDNLNAFTTRMLAEIRHALAAAESDERVVGIVLTGAGRGFCAGMDMNALNDMSGDGGDGADDLSALDAHPGDPAMGENFQVTYSYLLSIRKPLLAAVNGACAGLGFCFALLCDMRFVDATAKFTTSFSQRGLVAEHGVSWMLPRLIGPGRALDLLWSARKFDGVEAQRLGLVERLCEPGNAAADATAYIKQLAQSAAPMSLMVMKQQIYRHMNMELGEAMRDTNTLMAASLKRSDFREGVRSFMERRPPQFAPLKVDR
jgi:enoyl-CoA hydratase/carnithine racemase